MRITEISFAFRQTMKNGVQSILYHAKQWKVSFLSDRFFAEDDSNHSQSHDKRSDNTKHIAARDSHSPVRWLKTHLQQRRNKVPTSKQILEERKRRLKWSKVWQFTWVTIVISVLTTTIIVKWIDPTLSTKTWEWGERQLLRGSILIGFTIQNITIAGNEKTTREEILGRINIKLESPLYEFSLAEAKAQLESIPWVQNATIVRNPPSDIAITIVERKPVAIWQFNGKKALIDNDGVVLQYLNGKDALGRNDADKTAIYLANSSDTVNHPSGIVSSDYSSLLLVTGDGAATHVSEIIHLLNSDPSLAKRVTAAIYINNRRWDLEFDHRVTVKLPEQKTIATAWGRLSRLQESDKILERQIEVLDLRNPDRLYISLSGVLINSEKTIITTMQKTISNRSRFHSIASGTLAQMGWQND